MAVSGQTERVRVTHPINVHNGKATHHGSNIMMMKNDIAFMTTKIKWAAISNLNLKLIWINPMAL